MRQPRSPSLGPAADRSSLDWNPHPRQFSRLRIRRSISASLLLSPRIPGFKLIIIGYADSLPSVAIRYGWCFGRFHTCCGSRMDGLGQQVWPRPRRGGAPSAWQAQHRYHSRAFTLRRPFRRESNYRKSRDRGYAGRHRTPGYQTAP
jgi:hypothetical protein